MNPEATLRKKNRQLRLALERVIKDINTARVWSMCNKAHTVLTEATENATLSLEATQPRAKSRGK